MDEGLINKHIRSANWRSEKRRWRGTSGLSIALFEVAESLDELFAGNMFIVPM